MRKREQITTLIEDYIEKYAKGEEVVLNVREIRAWPAVDKLCANYNSLNISNAMDAVKFQHGNGEGVHGSSTYTVKYSK